MATFQVPIYMAPGSISINGCWYPPGTKYTIVCNTSTNQWEYILLEAPALVASTQALAMNSFRQQYYKEFPPSDFSQTHSVQPSAPQASDEVQNAAFQVLSSEHQQQYAPGQAQQTTMQPAAIKPLATPVLDSHRLLTSTLDRDDDDEKSPIDAPSPVGGGGKFDFSKVELQIIVDNQFEALERQLGKSLIDQFQKKIIKLLTNPGQSSWKIVACRNYSQTNSCPYEHRCQFFHEKKEEALGLAVEQARHDLLINWSLQDLEKWFPGETLRKFFEVYKTLVERFGSNFIQPFRNAILNVCTKTKPNNWKSTQCENFRTCIYKAKCNFYHNEEDRKLGIAIRKLLRHYAPETT